MRGRVLLLALTLLGPALAAAAAKDSAREPAKTAEEVIRRNVAARGGLEAWRRVDTLVWLGHLERADANHATHVPFVMQMRRPNLTRFELKEQFDHFTRIFDGTHGWKVRPGPDGRPDVKLFSPEEVKFAQAEYVIDGPLIDYQAKGVTATLDGLDTVEGHKAYRLSLVLPGGGERKVWVDVGTNLELRLDRPATHPLIAGKPVSVYYRDYATDEGLVLAHSIEVSGASGRPVAEAADRLVIDHVLVNQKLDAETFLPPATPMRKGGKVRIPGTGPGGEPVGDAPR